MTCLHFLTCRHESRPGRLVKVRQKADWRHIPLLLDNRENRSINLEKFANCFLLKTNQKYQTICNWSVFAVCWSFVQFSFSFKFLTKLLQSGDGNLIFFSPFSTPYSFFFLFFPYKYLDHQCIVYPVELFFIQYYQAVLTPSK